MSTIHRAAVGHPATDASLTSRAGDAARPTGASPEDAALVAQLLDGDEAAFTGLVEQYHGRLVRLALVFVSDHASAEEVVQDTWLAVLTGLRAFEGRSSLKTWMFSILTNRAKTRGQRDKRFVPFSALSDRPGHDEPAVPPSRFTSSGGWSAAPERWDEETPERLLLRHETRALIDRTIAELPAGQRTVVTLRDVEGLDAAEVCDILDITETNQRVLLHRARARIRGALERHLHGQPRPG
ncbi:MAG: RNA polymerase sigma factor [Acidobacteria bacterium]|nr:RNA polymerase sigma factor [Acidobacteriota bacterium]